MRLVSGAISGALKVALLRAMTFKAQSKIIPESEGQKWICSVKANGLGKISAKYCLW